VVVELAATPNDVWLPVDAEPATSVLSPLSYTGVPPQVFDVNNWNLIVPVGVPPAPALALIVAESVGYSVWADDVVVPARPTVSTSPVSLHAPLTARLFVSVA